MKHIFRLLCVAVTLLACSASVQGAPSQADNFGKIVIQPYLPTMNADGSMSKADNVLYNKLSQVITANSMAGSGFASPFIITAHPVEISTSKTGTAPVRTVVELNITLYVGNGMEGTLFSSASVDVKGVGNTYDDACAAAYRKIPVNDTRFKAMIYTAKENILEYYRLHGPELLKKAEAAAATKNFDQAYSVLLSIPDVCSEYTQAQKLLATYSARETQDHNDAVIARAKAAWAAAPNEAGASEAMSILNEISAPSQVTTTQMNALHKEITSRLKAVDDREFQLRKTAQANEHAENMAQINADASVKRAYARAREAEAKRPVYNYYSIHWW